MPGSWSRERRSALTSTSMTDPSPVPQVGDTVTATFRPQWENKGGKPYTITGEVWAGLNGVQWVGATPLPGAVSVDVVERAS